MSKYIYECWKSLDETEITFTTRENAKELRTQGLISEDAFLEYSINANTLEEACAIHNLRQG